MKGRTDSLTDELHIFVLSGFAIAQPLFDLLSRNAGFFVARGSQPLDVILLAFALAVLLPALLIAPLAASRLLGHRIHATLDGLLIVLLTAATALPPLKHIHGLSGTLIIAAAAAIGVVVTITYFHFPSARTFLTVLSPAVLLFPALFLFHSPVYKILRARAHDAAPAKVNATAPVVMVIFDELPVTSLMDEHFQIDAIRYPNFAALARDATWFRNATTVSDHTLTAVPAILSGLFPDAKLASTPADDRLPTAEDYPHSLFTLLGGSYDMQVFETQTALCPKTVCSTRPRDRRLAQRVESLLLDLGAVYLHIIFPPELETGLPVVTQTWSDFAAHGSLAGSGGKRDTEGPSRMFRKRARLFSRFLEAFTPSPKPSLHFLHILLPHVPWTYLPSGRTYIGTDIEGLDEEQWTEEEWPVVQGYQRHLLQVAYVDTLVGALVAKLKAVDLYDRSLIVVTADHGVSFRSGSSRRFASPSNLADLMTIPLLVKAPGQHQGEIDDRNIESIDILPTIAHILGIALPWSVDGRSALDRTNARRSEKMIFGYGSSKFGVEAAASLEATRDALLRKIALFGLGTDPGALYRAGRHGGLVGKRVSDLTVSGDERLEVSLAHRDRLERVDPEADWVPAQVVGHIRATDPSTTQLDLAVAVNGTIHATTRAHRVDRNELAFSAMVPEESFHRGSNAVEAFVVSSVEGKAHLASMRSAVSTMHFALSLQSKGDGEVIQSSNGAVLPILRVAGGFLESANIATDDVELSGWAGDIESAERAETVAVFSNGQLVYSDHTTMKRPDVMASFRAPGLERSGFQFLVPLTSFGDARDSEVRLFALSRKGVAFELQYPARYPFRKQAAAPPRVVPTTYLDEGSFDSADCHMIAGWARDARQPQVPSSVDVYDGDTLLATVVADQFRQDLATAGSDDSHHGFLYTAPTSLKDGRPHAIRVTISGTQVELDGTPKSITCPSFEGVHETADCNVIAGWAWNTTQPNASIDIEIYDNDILLGHVSADQFRQDLADAGKGNGAHAFTYTLPSGVKDGRPHTISVKTSEGDTHLVDTPKVIQCQQ